MTVSTGNDGDRYEENEKDEAHSAHSIAICCRTYRDSGQLLFGQHAIPNEAYLFEKEKK